MIRAVLQDYAGHKDPRTTRRSTTPATAWTATPPTPSPPTWRYGVRWRLLPQATNSSSSRGSCVPGNVGPGPCPGVSGLEPSRPEGIRADQTGIPADKAGVNVVRDDQAELGAYVASWVLTGRASSMRKAKLTPVPTKP